jgi:hypothetical protein
MKIQCNSLSLMVLPVIGTIALAIEPGRAQADVVLNSIIQSQGTGILDATNYGPDNDSNLATSFETGPGTWNINSVTLIVAGENNPSSAAGFAFIIADDTDPTASVSTPGATIGSFNVTGDIAGGAGFPQFSPPVTYYPSAPITLAGDSYYWLELIPEEAFQIYWDISADAQPVQVDGWSFDETEALQSSSNYGNIGPTLYSIDAAPIPEPATMSLLGIANALLLLRPKPRKPTPHCA